MQKLKSFIKPTIFLLITFILYLALLVIFHYSGLLKLQSVAKINFIVVSLVTFVVGISKGKKTSKKGYLEGLKLGLIVVGILFLLNTIFYRSFSLYLLLYYSVILASSTIGSMIGINLKR